MWTNYHKQEILKYFSDLIKAKPPKFPSANLNSPKCLIIALSHVKVLSQVQYYNSILIVSEASN